MCAGGQALVDERAHHCALKRRTEVGLIALGALGWLLSGRYRQTRDRSLTGLATPAKVSLLVIFGGLLGSGLLWLVSVVMS